MFFRFNRHPISQAEHSTQLRSFFNERGDAPSGTSPITRFYVQLAICTELLHGFWSRFSLDVGGASPSGYAVLSMQEVTDGSVSRLSRLEINLLWVVYDVLSLETGVAWSIIRYRPSELIFAGHSGQRRRIVPIHRSSFSRNRRGRAYSTDPICRPNPKLPKIGMDSLRLQVKQR